VNLHRNAKDKLEKYLAIMLENNWVCAAFALDHFNRGEASKDILEAYGKGSRYKESGRLDSEAYRVAPSACANTRKASGIGISEGERDSAS
jgi:hypothetical protein